MKHLDASYTASRERQTDLDVFAFTYDASASLPGGIAQITNTPYDRCAQQSSEFASPSSLSPLPQAPVLTGTFQVVNAGVGDQTDPHVDVNIASYRSVDADLGLTEIRYFDFATNTDHVVPHLALRLPYRTSRTDA